VGILQTTVVRPVLAVLGNCAKLGLKLIGGTYEHQLLPHNRVVLFGALPLFALLLAGALSCFAGIADPEASGSATARSTRARPRFDQRPRYCLSLRIRVPDRRVVKTIGYVEDLSETEAASDWEYRIAEKDALLSTGTGKRLAYGRQCCHVGIRKINAHYDQAGSQWRVSRVAYCGTAIISQ
jgi:hypothetical protein